MAFRFTTRAGHPTFVDLPWDRALTDWGSDRLVSPVRGISRHVVRFVAYGPDVYALKELPGHLAAREYQLLRALDSVIGVLRVDLEEACAFETAPRAFLDPADREDFVSRAHHVRAAPLAAAVVVYGMHVIESAAKLSF